MASLLAGIVGLILGAVIWTVSRRQAAHEPLKGGTNPVPPGGWLPLWGFGTDRTDATTGQPRSIWQLVFEISTAAYFAALGYRYGFSRDLLMIICFSIPLLVILLVDAWTRLIHTNIIIAGILLGWAFAAVDGGHALLRSLAGMAIGAGVFIFFFALAIAIYRNINVVPFGLGDVYLAAMIGAMVRLELVARALILGILLAGVILAALLAVRVLSRKQAVAYGPYLCLGALLTLYFS
jgi:leader peptidase (prepilin peptidase)/N-methyltransferase